MVLSDQIAEAHVVDVLWSASKDGYLKPKIRIKPVTLCGAKITYVTVHNEQWRRKNGIDKGAIIEIIRSGDVIPYALFLFIFLIKSTPLNIFPH